MRVFLWLDGEAASCSGATWSSKCYDSSETGNAATSLWINRWGSATARSEHNYIEDNKTTDLADRELILEAGEPEEDNGGYSPIIIATGTSGAYRLTSAASGVLFDIDGDGAPERVAWTEADAEIAFLALDRDGDGFITSGKELFGDATLHGSSNGFAALARMNMETNGGVKRGSVSSEDPLFARLLLWTDSNHNGISEFGELRAASEYLSDIGLSYADHHRKDGHGNLYRYRGWVHRRTAPGRNRAEEPGEGLMRRRQIFDVWLTTLR